MLFSAGLSVRRLRSFFAAQAGIIHAYERLMQGDSPSDIDGQILTIGNSTEQGYPIEVTIHVDAEINDPSSELHKTRPIRATASK